MGEDTQLFEKLARFLGLTKMMEKIEANGKNPLKFFSKLFWTGIFLFFASNAILFFLKSGPLIQIAVPTGIFIISFVLLTSFEILVYEKRLREKETLAVDFLFEASLLPLGYPFEKILLKSSREFGALGMELEMAGKMIQKGASVENALSEFKRRNKSEILERVADLLCVYYHSGMQMHESMRKTAEDILQTREIMQRKKASLTVQKYTLLFAGGLLVPLILGMLSGMVQGFDFSSMEFFFEQSSIEEKIELSQTVRMANIIYIAEYSLIAGFFLGLQENSFAKSFVYSFLLLPISISIYFLGGIFSA